jgi:zinc protease
MPIIHSLPGPGDITRVTLANGITILSRPNFNSPSVVVQGYLPAGALFDPLDKLGLADFTALALSRGTQQHNFQQIFDALESVGASLGVDGGTHSAGFSGRALVEDVDLLLGMLAEVLRQPSFPNEQVERLRSQILTGLAIRSQDTAEMASMAFDELVYPGHPYSHPLDGYPETILAISQEDIRTFHQETYGPQGLVIAIVGAIEAERAVASVAEAFGDWTNPDQPLPPELPALPVMVEKVIRQVDIPGKSQADLMIGVAGPQRRSEDFLAASLGNNILGQFGLYGRIGKVVREQSGLAYYASSSLSGGIGPGPWLVSAGVEPAHLDQTIELIMGEIQRFIQEPVSHAELADSQANYIGRLPLSLETNAGVAGALLSLERYQLGLDYYQRYPTLINAITPQDILTAAQRYLDPERMAIAYAGSFHV